MIPVITPEQRQQLDDQGFFVLENVFTIDEMNELSNVLETFHHQREEELVAAGGTSGISRAGEINFTCHIAERNEAVKAFLRRPEFVAITTQLLGSDVDLYWNQTVYKQPETKKEFPWHQDDGYTPVEPSPYLTLWLAINDATEENGCISVLPGSHKRGLVPHQQSDLGLVCYSNEEPDQGIRVPVKAGSMAVFWSLMFHKSGPNLSNDTRRAYVIQYSPAGLKHKMTGEVFTGKIPIARNGEAV